MDDINKIVSKLEHALQVKLKELKKGEEMSGNSYFKSYSYNRDQSIEYLKLEELCLSNMHFEDLSALEPIFGTLRYLTLIECSIADGWELQQIKKLESLSLNKCSISIDAEIDRKSDFYLSQLSISDLSLSSFKALTAVFYSVYNLYVTQCTFDNVSAFLQFDFVCTVSLDRVIFTNETGFDPNMELAATRQRHFQSLSLENMEIEHPGWFLPISKHLEYVEFISCTVSNLYELNLFPGLYSLTIDDTDYIGSGNDNQYLAAPDRGFSFLKFENMKLTDFDFFIPISDGPYTLELYNCEVASLEGISNFSNLEVLRLHPPIAVKDLNSPTNDLGSFELEECFIGPQTWDDVGESPDFNTAVLTSIAPYIRNLKIKEYNLVNTSHLKHFTQITELSFEKCAIDLNDYSSIAPQIQHIRFDSTEITNQDAFKHFSSLEHIEVVSFDDDIGHINLQKLVSLKKHLKKVDIFYWLIEHIDELKHFRALEELDTSVSSLELAQDILSIKSLKKLDLSIDEIMPGIIEPVTLNLRQLKNLKELRLEVDEGIRFKGIAHLQSLTTLDLTFDCDLENLGALKSLERLTIEGALILKVPRLESLKVLDLTIEQGFDVKVFKNFPKLEKLKVSIREGQKIEFKGLENLKVLILECNDIESIVSLENLPKLEELDLSNCEISAISKLDSLSNLKTLNLEENKIESIEGLENLKNLERLNLYYNKISDISLLNKLPQLREVNMAGNEIKKEDAEKQLDKPEILLWYGRPYIPFSISID